MINSSVDIAIMTTNYRGWDDRKPSLCSERVIAALPEAHALATRSVLHWSDLTDQELLIQQRVAGPEMQRLLAAKLDPLGRHQLLHQDVSVDRLASLVGAGFGICLILEGETVQRVGGQAARLNGRRVQRSATAWSRSSVPFTTAVRTFSIKCAPLGDRGICC
jgi:DNA-binding transcriptional LysR family regulator